MKGRGSQTLWSEAAESIQTSSTSCQHKESSIHERPHGNKAADGPAMRKKLQAENRTSKLLRGQVQSSTRHSTERVDRGVTLHARYKLNNPTDFSPGSPLFLPWTTLDRYWPLQTGNTPQELQFWICSDPVTSHHSLASSKLLTSSHLSICSASNTNRTTCSLGATNRWWRDHQCCSLHLSAVMMLHLTGVELLGYKSNTVVLQISSENQIQKFTFTLKPQTCISISHKIITMMIFCWTRSARASELTNHITL